ncbi:MAG: LamG domain-containing protein [Candidatus Pacebacteria bacterium]|nr:LamG domain-containing protein [Candidatus Paceibacterota bacterium]
MQNSLIKILILSFAIFIAGFNVSDATKNTVLDFDGTSDFVAVADIAVLDQANQLSLSVWIEPDDTPTGDEYILYRYNNYYLKINSSKKIVGGLNDSTERVTSATVITCDGDTWTHIEMTYNKDATGTDEIKLYINGVLDAVGDYSTAISVSDKKLYFGAGDIAGDNTPENWFDGQIDGVLLYQYARLANDVQLDYNEGLATHLGSTEKSCSEDPASCMDYGLVGFWNMDEGAGTTAYDGSGNGNDGTLTSGPKWTTDSAPLLGGAGGGSVLDFDGVDDSVNISPSSLINDLPAVTISMWVNAESFGESNKSYLLSKEYNGGDGFWAQVHGSYSALHFQVDYDNTNLKSWSADNSFSSSDFNIWKHIVITWDGSMLANNTRFYKDGVELSHGISETSNAVGNRVSDVGSNLYIGNKSFATRTFDGLIDEMRIYNRTLSAEEIRHLYNKGEPVAQWSFDEGIGATAYDSTNNDNDGTFGDGTCVAGAGTCPSWVEGKYGSGLDFDGVDDYVDCGNDPNLTISKALTISAWVKQDVLSPSAVGIVSKMTDETHNNYSILIHGSGSPYFLATIGGVAKNTYSTEVTILPLDEWHYLAGTFDGTTMRYYYDGVREGNEEVTGGNLDSATQNVYIGKRMDVEFDGTIDEVRIYNYARTPEQIQIDYNAGVATHFN